MTDSRIADFGKVRLGGMAPALAPSRRGLLVAGVAAIPAAWLAGCAGGTGTASDVTPYQVISDVNTLIVGLGNAVTALATQIPPPLPPVIAASVQSLLAQAQTVASSLSGSMLAAQAAPIVQQIEVDLNAVVAALAPLPIPPPYNMVVTAAAVLLPVLELFINKYLPQPAPAITPARAVLLARAWGMTPDQARAVLANTSRMTQ